MQKFLEEVKGLVDSDLIPAGESRVDLFGISLSSFASLYDQRSSSPTSPNFLQRPHRKHRIEEPLEQNVFECESNFQANILLRRLRPFVRFEQQELLVETTPVGLALSLTLSRFYV